MKKIIFSLIVCLLFNSCTKKKHPLESVVIHQENQQQIVFNKSTMEPINGVLTCQYGEMGNYKDGVMFNGLHKVWFDDGQLRSKINIIDGFNNREEEYWTENGEYIRKYIYSDSFLTNWNLGCMDSIACNYNPLANLEDSSCVLAQKYFDCDGSSIIKLGDTIFGGIVFHLDELNEKGLVASLEDIGYCEWGCQGSIVKGALGIKIGTGMKNTTEIVRGCDEKTNAAFICLNYNVGEYNDWYLPSLIELRKMYNNLGQGSKLALFGGSGNWYWSSTEINTKDAWSIYFNGGVEYPLNKNGSAIVRPIRSFNVDTTQ